GHPSGAVAYKAADVLDGHPVAGQQRHERVAQLPRGPVLPDSSFPADRTERSADVACIESRPERGSEDEALFLPELTRPQVGPALTLLMFCERFHGHHRQREGAPGPTGLDVRLGPYGAPHIDVRGQAWVSVQMNVIPPKCPRLLGA